MKQSVDIQAKNWLSTRIQNSIPLFLISLIEVRFLFLFCVFDIEWVEEDESVLERHTGDHTATTMNSFFFL